MIKITRKTRAMEVVGIWRNTYKNWDEFPSKVNRRTKREILSELIELGSEPSPDDIDTIIGNTTWTQVPECGECGDENNSFVIRVGEEEDHESMTFYLCKICIRKLGEYL